MDMEGDLDRLANNMFRTFCGTGTIPLQAKAHGLGGIGGDPVNRPKRGQLGALQ